MTKQTNKRPSAFMKPVAVSSELAEIVGKGPMPRTEVTKKLWDYIKKHDLQSKQKKRFIEPDTKLSRVLGTSQPVDMFKMTSLVAKHIKPSAAKV